MEKYNFREDRATTVLMTFDLIIRMIETTPQKLGNGKMRSSITIEELKELRKTMHGKYFNPLVNLT